MDAFHVFSELPQLFAPLPRASIMSQWDQTAQKLGLPGAVLMENAARSAFQALLATFQDLTDLEVGLLIGSGNNGGDAAAIGRYLHEAGLAVTAYLIKDFHAYQGECAHQLQILQKLGLPLADRTLLLSGSKPCDLLLDGLLGTGFQGPLRPDLCELIRSINALKIPRVVAVDIPSGLSADTGLPEPEALVASHTICMSACKKGLILPCARPFTGQITTVPIGLPASVRVELPADSYLVDEQLGLLSPEPPANSYKNLFGHVAIVGGGDPAHTGAAHLAARAALRAGAGLVTAIAKAAQAEAIRLNLAEIMLCPLEESGHGWPERVPKDLERLLPKLSSLVIGPGFGLGPDAHHFLEQLLTLPTRPPMVIDADALTLLARHDDLLDQVRSDDILTPHPGEAAALLGMTSRDLQRDRYQALARLTARTRAIVVLKGAGTLVGQYQQPVLVSPWDLPALAIGGAGDVLAGLLGSMLAQRDAFGALFGAKLCFAHKGDFVVRLYGLSCKSKKSCPSQAPLPSSALGLILAAYAVSRHALAARRLQAEYPQRGFLAHELADSLGRLSC